ncbi:2Fe-2S iron-sulfur cluster-binding protein [Ensifer aridi]|uniref:2Fe-2S iron-sulfur cluster-binding protein n=1 Tax=Ensifer aridi TaxID=1708715 RepID=UPI00047BB745|nr:2Fe-2S iron-sulfur cluster-binding protein [Ensifer aridi]
MDTVATQIKVVVSDRDGTLHELTWEPEQSLMEVIRDNDLPVLASCGGCCACATCHVHVEPSAFAQLNEIKPDEADLLEEVEGFDPKRSRLACQISYSDSLDGLHIELVPY